MKPGKLVNGIPDSFTFVFANVSDHDVRMPKPLSCINDFAGIISLKVDFTPSQPVRNGTGSGCATGISDLPSVRFRARDWPVLKPGNSMSISLARKQLQSEQQAPGRYEFWAEYIPPDVPASDARILAQEGIHFPQLRLVSPHLIFVRKSPPK